MTATPHMPVMLKEMLAALAPQDGEIYVDGTFGAGGYSRAILTAAQCKVYAIDRDPNVQSITAQLQKEFAGRFVFLAGGFGDMVELMAEHGVSRVDGVVLDIGVSSMQLDQASRGFSFRRDGPLDMRMACSGISAADVVNQATEETLADIIYQYGEEPASRRIAAAIVNARQESPITRTAQLADIIRRAVKKNKDSIDPATRTFQALRIHVNDELGELSRALVAAETLLKPKGRLVVVTFHSLEDRIVKEFFKSRSGATSGASRHMPMHVEKQAPAFFDARRKLIVAEEEELSRNPRARSAKLRVAVRTQENQEVRA